MNDRVQKVLDGELPRDRLTPDDAAELARIEHTITRVLRSVPGGPIPDLGGVVLRRIESAGDRRHGDAGRGGWGSAMSWLWEPRPLTWRPVYGFAAAALVTLMLAVSVLREARVPAQAGHVLVEFRLEAPQARQVRLAGDFTSWQPAHTLTRSGPGVWTVVVPLTPGVHEYAFVVDGDRWVPDPAAPAVSDGFGGVNSRVAVISADRGGAL